MFWDCGILSWALDVFDLCLGFCYVFAIWFYVGLLYSFCWDYCLFDFLFVLGFHFMFSNLALCYWISVCVWPFCVALVSFCFKEILVCVFECVLRSCHFVMLSLSHHILVIFPPPPIDRSLCLSGAEEEFSSGRSLPFINPSPLETLRALVHEIQSSETDPEIWKNCEVLEGRLTVDLEAASYSGLWVMIKSFPKDSS